MFAVMFCQLSTQIIAEIWQHSDIETNKTRTTGKMLRQMVVVSCLQDVSCSCDSLLLPHFQIAPIMLQEEERLEKNINGDRRRGGK